MVDHGLQRRDPTGRLRSRRTSRVAEWDKSRIPIRAYVFNHSEGLRRLALGRVDLRDFPRASNSSTYRRHTRSLTAYTGF